MTDFPYPGIRPFKREETDIFFGRDEQSDELIERLGRTRFLAVVGVSGCGKSSLVRTGMIAGLETGFLAGAGAGWRVAEMRPGERPFENLAEALSPLFPDLAGGPDNLSPDHDKPDHNKTALESSLRRGALSLHELLASHPLPEDVNLLLLVDQFEELFRYADEKTRTDEAAAFTALLLASAKNYPMPDGRLSRRIYVVITMRSDFIGDCARFPGLAEAINEGLYLTPRLTREQLREAIEEPPSALDCRIEPGLVARLLEDAGDNPDQLPLLQHVLQWMWLREKEKTEGKKISGEGQSLHDTSASPEPATLTLKDYQDLGGFGTALSDRLDGILDKLSDKQKEIAEIMFRSLAKRDVEQRDIRRPARLGRIAELAGVRWQEAKEVVERFQRSGRNFIVSSPAGELHETSMLDVCHESLLRRWETLRKWLADEAASADMYIRLEKAARRWEAGEGNLWERLDLAAARQWRDRVRPTPLWAERYGEGKGKHFSLAERFLEESLAAEQRRLTAERNKQKKRWIFAGLLMVFVILVAVVLFVQLEKTKRSEAKAVQAQKQAEIEKTKAEAATAMAESTKKERTTDLFESRLTHASLLARQGVEDYAEARKILEETYPLDEDVPDHRRHARNLSAWYVRLMGGEAKQVYQGADASLHCIAVSPDGRTLAAGGENGTLVMFDMESGKIRHRLEGHDKMAGSTGSVWSVVFHPECKWLASAGEDSTIRFWSLPTGECIEEWEAPDVISAMAVNPDGSILASGGDDNAVTLWDAETGEKIKTLTGHRNIISENGLTFSPDGGLLASASYDHTARLWDTASGETIHLLEGFHTGTVEGVAFDSTGSTVATAGGPGDKRIVVWDANSGRPVWLLRGHQNAVFGLAFLESSRYLISGGRDRNLRLWDVESDATLRIWQGHETGITHLAAYPPVPEKLSESVRIYTAANDGTVQSWAPDTPYFSRIALPGEPNSAAITPDGTSVVVGFADGSLRWYSISDGKMTWEKKSAHDSKIIRMAFRKDGTLLASGGFDDKARIWRVHGDRLEEIQILEGHTDLVHGLAFSPAGKTLATASYDGRIGLFAVGADEKLFFDAAREGSIMSVAFDASGARLLSGNHGDQTAKLWNVADQTMLQEFPKSSNLVLWAAFSSDGRQVAVAGRGAIITVYGTSDGRIVHRLIGHENTVYKAIFSPDSQQLATISSDATLRFWDLSTGTQLFALRLPTNIGDSVPLWDFDFRCSSSGCRIAVPLTKGELLLYDLGTIYD